MNEDFVLLRPEEHAQSVEWADGKNNLEVIKCSATEGHTRSGNRLGALHVSMRKAPNPKTILWTVYSELFVHVEIVSLFAKHGFTGLEPSQAVLHCSDTGSVNYEYFELKVRGWGGFPSVASSVHLRKYCTVCNFTEFSCFPDAQTLFDQSQWDGSDFFFVWPAPRFIFVHKRVVEVLEREMIKGWGSVLPRDVRCTGGLSPGRINSWLDQNKLAEVCNNASSEQQEYLK